MLIINMRVFNNSVKALYSMGKELPKPDKVVVKINVAVFFSGGIRCRKYENVRLGWL